MSLVEATIILAVVSLLSAVMAPAINAYMDQARQARAREDVKTIADAIQQFITDNGEHQFLVNGSNGTDSQPPTHPDSNRINLLVSDGDIPALATAVSGDTLWTLLVDVTTNRVDTLSNHLGENTPNEATGNRYRHPSDINVTTPGGNNIDFARSESSSFNAPYAWRGAYLGSPARPDPWGNRYAVNVLFLDPSPSATVTGVSGVAAFADYARMDVFVVSAGADEEIDTKIAQDGAVPGDDDFIFIVSSHAK